MSRFTHTKNLRDTAVTVSALPPWQIKSPSLIPAGLTKEQFREWSANTSTNHVFYAPVVGVNSGLRISHDNPVALRHGFVADYDSDLLVPLSDQDLIAMVDASLLKKGIRPGWLCRTFSGKARLVWEFDKPVAGEPEVLAEKALENFITQAGVKRLLPGYDETSSKPNQYFELGTSWTDLQGAPVDSATLSTCIFDAAKRLTLSADSDIEIPIEAVADEIESRWPGQLVGDISWGTRVPLFWIPDGNPRIGAMIVTNGVVCYSDRAGKGFLTWREILGDAFVRAYESKQVESVLSSMYYDGAKYWVKVMNNRWVPRNKEDVMLHIRAAGFSNQLVKGQRLSPAETALKAVQDTRSIDGTAPFLFDTRETVEWHGEKFLNVSTRMPMSPAGGDGDPSRWPWMLDFLSGFLDSDPDITGDPMDFLLAWIQRMWKSARQGRMELGHLVILAGAANTGKSLFAQYILRQIMGGGTDASAYLLAAGGFNKQLAEVAVWNVDDGVSASNFQDHRKFSEMLKKTAANPEVNYHPKYRDSVVLPWRGRVVVTCNTDAASLDIIPQLDGTILDKIMLFRLTDRKPDFPDSIVLEKIIREELPHFLDWLDTWVPPIEVSGGSSRYGIRAHHHGELVRSAQEKSQAQNFADLVDMWAEQMIAAGNTEDWRGNPSQLMQALLDSNLKDLARSYSPQRAGTLLAQLKATGYSRILRHMTGAKRNIYVLQLN